MKTKRRIARGKQMTATEIFRRNLEMLQPRPTPRGDARSRRMTTTEVINCALKVIGPAQSVQKTHNLPTDAKARKAIPVYSGFVKYFPRSMIAIAELSRIGNDQHNPGQPLHWDKSKSADHLDCEMRHMLDEVLGTKEDTDGVLHKVKKAWRALADLEIELEKAS